MLFRDIFFILKCFGSQSKLFFMDKKARDKNNQLDKVFVKETKKHYLCATCIAYQYYRLYLVLFFSFFAASFVREQPYYSTLNF